MDAWITQLREAPQSYFGLFVRPDQFIMECVTCSARIPCLPYSPSILFNLPFSNHIFICTITYTTTINFHYHKKKKKEILKLNKTFSKFPLAFEDHQNELYSAHFLLFLKIIFLIDLRAVALSCSPRILLFNRVLAQFL